METLKRQIDFQNLKKNGKRFRPNSWLIVNYSENSLGYLRFGFTASRQVEKAVIRNKLKRWSKEYFKKRNTESIDINIVFRKVKDEHFYKELKHEKFNAYLDKFWNQIKRRA